MRCPHCHITLVSGVALRSTTVGSEDFGGDYGAVGTTRSIGGPGKMLSCMKCPDCGYSVLTDERVGSEVMFAPPSARKVVDAWYSLGEYVTTLERGGCTAQFYDHLVMQAKGLASEIQELLFAVEQERYGSKR